MSYNKTNWQTGDIITADKLNNIEDGISNNQSNMVPGDITELAWAASGTVMIAPSDGWYYAMTRANAYHDVVLGVNPASGGAYDYRAVNWVNFDGYACALCPVKKGDYVKLVYTSATFSDKHLKFIKAKE